MENVWYRMKMPCIRYEMINFLGFFFFSKRRLRLRHLLHCQHDVAKISVCIYYNGKGSFPSTAAVYILVIVVAVGVVVVDAVIVVVVLTI